MPRFILRCKEKIGESARSPEAKSSETRGQAGRNAKTPHCTHKNTQIALLIFGNYAIISLGGTQVCASDAHRKTTVRQTKTGRRETLKHHGMHDADTR